MTFGRLVQSLRQEREQTQQLLADNAGLSVVTIRQYERGVRLPSLAHAAAVARALNVSVEVLTACDEMTPPVNDGKKGARG